MLMPKKNVLTADQINILKEFVAKKEGSAAETARAQAILLDARMNPELIQEITGLGRSAFYKWKKRFIESGISSLLDKEKKFKALLTKAQMREVVKVLKQEKPRRFGFQTDFWTTTILARLIEEQYSVRYKSKRRLYLLFQEAKFTYHKPGQQYRNRSQALIDRWIEEETPEIKKHFEDDDTVLLTADEMVLSSQTTFQKIWLPVNNFPKIDVSNERKNRSIYGFHNVKNGVQHAFKTEWQNSENTCEVLEKLLQLYPRKKVVILWDNAPWHRSKEIRAYLQKTKHNLTLIAFPPYAPELNPQEHIWKEGRNQVTHNNFIENIDKATDEFVNHLNSTIFKYRLLDFAPRSA
jgi:transposase